jgi:hypothetical protein
MAAQEMRALPVFELGSQVPDVRRLMPWPKWKTSANNTEPSSLPTTSLFSRSNQRSCQFPSSLNVLHRGRMLVGIVIKTFRSRIAIHEPVENAVCPSTLDPALDVTLGNQRGQVVTATFEPSVPRPVSVQDAPVS